MSEILAKKGGTDKQFPKVVISFAPGESFEILDLIKKLKEAGMKDVWEKLIAYIGVDLDIKGMGLVANAFYALGMETECILWRTAIDVKEVEMAYEGLSPKNLDVSRLYTEMLKKVPEYLGDIFEVKPTEDGNYSTIKIKVENKHLLVDFFRVEYKNEKLASVWENYLKSNSDFNPEETMIHELDIAKILYPLHAKMRGKYSAVVTGNAGEWNLAALGFTPAVKAKETTIIPPIRGDVPAAGYEAPISDEELEFTGGKVKRFFGKLFKGSK